MARGLSYVLAMVCAMALACQVAAVCKHQWCSRETVPSNVRVPVLFAVSHKNLDVLEEMFWAIADRNSDSFRKHLTHDELNNLIGNPEGTALVTKFLETSDLDMSEFKVTPGGEFISCRAPVRQVEALLGATYKFFYHPDGRRVPRSSTGYTVPAAIADEVDFIGHVTSFPSQMRAFGISGNGTRPVQPASDDVFGGDDDGSSQPTTDTKVTPAVIFSAYGISPHSGSQGSMAVFETLNQAYEPDSLATFQQTFDVPAMKVSNVIGPNKYSSCTSNPNNCGEANLDVQYIMGVAQGIPLTFWSIPASDSTPYLDWITAVAADSNAPLVQSVSYGDVEAEEDASTMTRTNTEFQKMGVRGLSIFIASGDDGVANFPARSNSQYCGFNPSFPATSPYVTAVGATQFIGGSPSKGQEGASVEHKPPAIITTGGGFSAQFSRPSYQDSAVQTFLASANVPSVPHTASGFPSAGFNANGRGYPDVAALGHNYQVIINGNQYSVDGTSAAAPVTAAMFALINDARLANGQSSLGFLNTELYNMQGSSVFTDLREGTNRCCAKPNPPASQVCCPHGFDATSGWDPVTGLGTINFQNMKEQLTN